MAYALESAIPGLPRLSKSATNIIGAALDGLPSPSESRLSNAYFGAGSGLDPTSDFLRNRGFDLYRRNANARQQQGINDLLNLVGTYSGNVAPTPGQEMQDRQQTAQLQQQGQQFQSQFGFEQQQWQKQLELLNKYLSNPAGGTGGTAPGTSLMDSSMYTNTYQPFWAQGNNYAQGKTPGTGYSMSADGWYRPAQSPSNRNLRTV